MKKWFKNFIKKLEQANKESFGDERLDYGAGGHISKIKLVIIYPNMV